MRLGFLAGWGDFGLCRHQQLIRVILLFLRWLPPYINTATTMHGLKKKKTKQVMLPCIYIWLQTVLQTSQNHRQKQRVFNFLVLVFIRKNCLSVTLYVYSSSAYRLPTMKMRFGVFLPCSCGIFLIMQEIYKESKA